jgi:hypothetical protein
MIYENLRQSLNAKGAENVAQIVLRDDEAIELAQEMSGLSSAAEVYEAIAAGDAKFMGRKLVVHD